MSLLMKVSQPPPSEIEMLKVTQMMMMMTLKRLEDNISFQFSLVNKCNTYHLKTTVKELRSCNLRLRFAKSSHLDLEVSIRLCFTVFASNRLQYLLEGNGDIDIFHSVDIYQSGFLSAL